MGYDLIGCLVIYPEELTEKELNTLLKQSENLLKVLQHKNLPRVLYDFYNSKDVTLSVTSDILSVTNNRLPATMVNTLHNSEYWDSLMTSLEYLSYDDIDEEEAIENYEEMLEEDACDLKNIILSFKEKNHPKFLPYRDSATRIIKILNRNYILAFAGDSSYGDEPQGLGYETLGYWMRFGILDYLESLLPVESNSEMFLNYLNKT